MVRNVIIIPARYRSTRFPGKPLAMLLGKPMILWVCELSARALGEGNVFVATEDERIADTVRNAGFNAVMTSDEALTGTDRLAEAAEQIDAEIYINVQGDEPLVHPSDILKIRDAKEANFEDVINGYCWLNQGEDPTDINIPKVITNEKNELLYISRLALPGYKDRSNAPHRYKKQVCIYAFTRSELRSFRNFSRKSELERCEDIEILRFLEMNKKVRMVETAPGSLAVDTENDIFPAELALRKTHGIPD
jgi:3-deoxy-manno-octulosonate cytidylyltransferase (CMP-KDO synthetase)